MGLAKVTEKVWKVLTKSFVTSPTACGMDCQPTKTFGRYDSSQPEEDTVTKIQALFHCCLIAAFCFTPNATGGLIRHDREIDQYREAASRTEFACVGRIRSADKQKYATGVLVSPRLVLTCAHVIRKGSISDQTWLFGSQPSTATRVFHVPGFLKDNLSEAHFEGLDLVLVELDRDVPDIQPAKRYRSRDEAGKQAWLIGHGVVGDGKSGRHEPATQMRLAGQNALDAIGSDSPYSLFSDRTLMFDFDGPGDADPNSLGAAEPMDLELGNMGGDSGGGVFVETNVGLRLAGIIFGGVDAERKHLGGKLYQYGQVGAAVRVSSYNQWIDAVIADPNSFDDECKTEAKVTFRIIDDRRQPVTEFTVLGATPEGNDLRTIGESSELTIDAIEPTEQRVLVIRNADNTHGKVVRLDTALRDELNGTIQLLPLATVRGRLFDLTGKPLANDSISMTVVPNQRHLRRLESVKTDANGNIEFKVPCWSKYLLWYDGNRTAFETTVSVRPGKTYDLGKVRVNTMEMTRREDIPQTGSR